MSRKIQIVIAGLAGLLLFVAVSGRGEPLSALDLFPMKREGREFRNPRFSPDGRWLAFDICQARVIETTCRNVIYDIRDDRYIAWRDAQGRPITYVSFSKEDSKATFVVGTNSPFLGFGEYEERVAIADVREGRYRFVTPGPGFKLHPEFWKGDTVIYVGTEADDARRRKSKYVYVVEPAKPPRKLIETGFYAASGIRPHWDGERIWMGEPSFTVGAKGYDEILSLRPSNRSIEVLSLPISSEYQPSYSNPAVASLTNEIYVTAILKAESSLPGAGFRYDVFAFDGRSLNRTSKLERGQVKRHIEEDVRVVHGPTARRISRVAGYISEMDVTDDGRFLALVTADSSSRGISNFQLLLYDPRTHTQRRLNPIDIQERVFYQQDE